MIKRNISIETAERIAAVQNTEGELRQPKRRCQMFGKRIVLASIIVLCLFGGLIAQDKPTTENSADQTLKSTGRVNPSTLGMEMSIPLGAYPGRGINVPVSINYSSKVWRQEYFGSEPRGAGNCMSIYDPIFSEHSASGWTSSLGVAYVEYTGRDNRFNGKGFPLGDQACAYDTTIDNFVKWIKRIQIHLPNGESHELRLDDTAVQYPAGADYTDPNSAFTQSNWYGTYYSVDGSKLKYVESASGSTIYMPDGSYYDFGAVTTLGTKTIRKAATYKDVNGNTLTFNAPNSTFPNGYWTDTLGRSVPVPMPLEPPTAAATVDYVMPSFNAGTMTYRFHWKQLKGSSAAESGLTNFSDTLRIKGDYNATAPPAPSLFGSDMDDKSQRAYSEPVFNPIVLTAVELPDGRKYEFSYNIYGEIEKIKYPTGGEEVFQFGSVKGIEHSTSGNQPMEDANRGVVQRDVKENPSASPYTWTYSTADEVVGSITALKITTNAPDSTKSERLLYKSVPFCSGCSYGTLGYGDILGGMALEERTFASTGQIVTTVKTTWDKTEFTIGNASTGKKGEWHPRVTKVESIIYDLAGTSVSASQTMAYAGTLTDRDNHLDVNLAKQYGFTATTGALGPLERQTEMTHVEYDTAISQSIRDTYTAANIVSLPSKTFIKNAGGTVVAKSEVAYDEAGYSAATKGNATRARTWLDTSSSWLETRAKYDSYGNVIETTDPKGNITTTQYSATYSYAYPTSVTTPVPDPSGTNGSNAAFSSSTVYDLTTGLPTSSTDVNGQTTYMEYNDILLRPTRVVPPSGGAITETSYGAGTSAATRWVKVRTQIDTVKWKEAFSYFDGLGRTTQTRSVDSNGDVFVDTEYDSAGRVKRVTNPYRSGETIYWTTNTYDVVGRVVEVTLPDTAKVLTNYAVSNSGVLGAKKTITDQAGKTRAGISDALGRMIRVIEDPTGTNLATDYTFDTVGKLRKTTQGSQYRFFLYDSLGRLIRSKQPEQDVNSALNITDSVTGNSGWSNAYSYDANGNILNTTDARNISISATYDNFNRIKYRDYSDATPDVSFYYDGRGLGSVPNYSKGKTTKVGSSVSETRYTSFDNLGRLLTHQQITNGQTFDTAYTYNLSGALIEETYPSGRKVLNTLDVDGDLAQVQTKTAAGSYQNRASNFTYLSHGGVKSLMLGNSRWENAQYNNRLQITQIGMGTTSTDTSMLKIDYDYGTSTQNNGSLKQQTIAFTGYSGSIVQSYTYDNLNRIQAAQETYSGGLSWKETFSYDRFGNRRFDAANTTTIPGCAQANCNPTISQANNRFDSGQGYLYDQAGNVTQDAGGQRFIFDAENHQIGFFVYNNSGSTPDATYLYDGDGKRVRKIDATRETVFVYNAGGSLIAEYETNFTPVTANTKYLTQDHLGSPRTITDQSGNVLSRHDYRAFGEEVYTGTASRTTGQGYGQADGVRKQYTGYERDYESGLDFAQARYYNSKLGRFTSADPLMASANVKDPQTLNRYSYAMNSPYKFTDPLGLIADSSGGSPTGPTCPTKIGCPQPSLTPPELEGPPPPTNPDWISPEYDSRPLITDMVDNSQGVDDERNEDLSPWRNTEGRYRFGTGHDGEHVLGDIDGSVVRAIKGLTGVILGHYRQEKGLDGAPDMYSVYVRLDSDKSTVLVLKDLILLSDKVKTSPVLSQTGGGLFYRNGSVRSKIALDVGDVIGKTRPWRTSSFQGKNKNKVGMHFLFVKFANIEAFRKNIGEKINNVSANPEYFPYVPCGSSSVVRCN